MPAVIISDNARNENEENLYRFYVDHFLPLKGLINEAYEASGDAKLRAEELESLYDNPDAWLETFERLLDCEKSKAKMEALGFEYFRGTEVRYYHPELKAKISIYPQEDFDNTAANLEGAILDILSFSLTRDNLFIEFLQERCYDGKHHNNKTITNENYIDLMVCDDSEALTFQELIEADKIDLIKYAVNELSEVVMAIQKLRVDERSMVNDPRKLVPSSI